jgi:hypothetical protein
MKKPRNFTLVILLSGTIFAFSCTHVTGTKPISNYGVYDSDMKDAVAIAVSALHNQPPGSAGESYILSSAPKDDYILTSAQQIIFRGKYIWRVTFKPRQLLPKDPSKGIIGAGGEIFVNVDLSTKTTEIGGGE